MGCSFSFGFSCFARPDKCEACEDWTAEGVDGDEAEEKGVEFGSPEWGVAVGILEAGEEKYGKGECDASLWCEGEPEFVAPFFIELEEFGGGRHCAPDEECTQADDDEDGDGCIEAGEHREVKFCTGDGEEHAVDGE